MHYKSVYIQKGYGIGGIFRGIARLFRPIARNVVKILNKPEVKKVLKTVGKETINTGSELLIDKLQGKHLKSRLDKRIDIAKKRIVESIQDGIRSRRKANNINKYHHIPDEVEDPEINVMPYKRKIQHASKVKKKTSYLQANKRTSGNNIPPRNKPRKRKIHRTVFD